MDATKPFTWNPSSAANSQECATYIHSILASKCGPWKSPSACLWVLFTWATGFQDSKGPDRSWKMLSRRRRCGDRGASRSSRACLWNCREVPKISIWIEKHGGSTKACENSWNLQNQQDYKVHSVFPLFGCLELAETRQPSDKKNAKRLLNRMQPACFLAPLADDASCPGFQQCPGMSSTSGCRLFRAWK